MIKQVLSPQFLRERARQLDGKPVTPPRPRPLDGLRRRRDRLAPFIPSDRGQSLLQSALQEGIEDDPKLAVDTVDTEDPCGEGPDKGTPRAANETLGGSFGPNDFGWLQTKLAELTSTKVGFRTEPATVEIATDARVLLVSDWGTGLRGAQQVGKQMRRKVEEAVEKQREVHVIHLGDVYYCGTKREYVKHFFEFWPVRVGDPNVHSWNLNGNHDMYSGGHAYFDVIAGQLEDEPRSALFKPQNGRSYFKLFNEHWRIYGLDTAHDKDQHLGEQLAWLKGELRSDTGQAMLLSHHQLDSVYDRGRVNGVLLKELGPELDDGLVRAWFWGHEHRLIRYHPFHRVEYPRCIGNGGVPEVVEQTFFSLLKKLAGLVAGLLKHQRGGIPPRIADNYTQSWPARGVHWRRHAFVCLDLQGEEITASYIDQCGGEAFPDEPLR